MGGCVCYVRAPVYIGRSQPTVSDFRPRLSARLSLPRSDVAAFGGDRRFSPLPHQPGAPRLGTEPTALPTAGAVAPAAPDEQVR